MNTLQYPQRMPYALPYRPVQVGFVPLRQAEKPVFQPTAQSLHDHLPMAGLLLLTGFLLRALPSFNRPGANWLPTDWKAWGKVALGILATSQFNKALQWTPPAWLAGMETVAVIHPLTSGISKASLGQLAVIAPLVGGVVEFANRLNEDLAPQLKEDLKVPTLATRLAISIGLAIVGVKLFPPLFKELQQRGVFPKTVGAKANGMLASSMATCARGCTPGGIICLSEMGEIFGGMGSWLKGDSGKKQEARR